MNEKKRKNGSYNLTVWKEILIILRVVGEEERKVGKNSHYDLYTL